MYELIIGNKNYSSWSMRPWVLMRGLGIPFRETLLPFHTNHGETAFTRFTPSGKVPCLVDGDTKVWDSFAITEYLAEKHAGVWPADAKARAWARSAAAEMHSGFFALRNDCSMSVGVRIRLNQIGSGLRADLARLAALWEEGLRRYGGPLLGGAKYSAVDAFYAPVATRIQTYGLELPPTAAAYAQRLLDLPAVKEWVAAGIAETFRDAPHEKEILSVGKLLEDLRAKEHAG